MQAGKADTISIIILPITSAAENRCLVYAEVRDVTVHASILSCEPDQSLCDQLLLASLSIVNTRDAE